MVGQKSGGIGSVGGASINGLASQPWVEDNYLSKEFFSQLFTVITTIHTVVTDSSDDVVSDTTTTGILLPNDVPGTTTTVDEETGNTTTVTVAIESVRVLGGLWTNSYLSALGQNSGGGGGGGSSTLADLLDVQLSTPLQDGQVLKYSSTLGKWVNGSGGGIGTVTSVATGTGLTGGPITGSGTISINLTFQTYINHGETAYGWGNHADAGYATAQDVANTLSSYATQQWVTTALTDYATKTWVVTALADYATKTWVVTALTDYATKTWVGQNYLALAGGTMTGLITRASSGWWVKGRDNAVIKQTDGGVSGHGWATVFSAKTLLGSWELGTISEQGEKLILAYTTDSDYNNDVNTASTLYFPTGSGTIARLSDNVYSATQLQTARTIWGQSFDGTGNITGNMEDVGIILQNGQYTVMGRNEAHGALIESLTNTVTMGLHNGNGVGWDTRSGSGYMLQLVYDSSNTVAKKYTRVYDGLRIGDGMLVWDSTNNALKVINADGTAGNLYATGGVSALGMSAGASSINSMTFGYLTVNNQIAIERGGYSNHISTDNAGWLSITLSEGLTLDNDIRLSYGSIYVADGTIRANGLYLASNVYLYYDNNDIKVRINSTTYTLTKS